MSPFDALPTRVVERIAVHVTNDALRQIRGGHPWLWSDSVTRTSKPGRAGDLAVIFDDKRKFAAIGLWDPGAPIAARILHQGSPRQIDADFFVERMIAAIDRRRRLEDDPTTTGYRLVHGENDKLPGLVIDRYDRTLVIRLDTVAWVPHFATIADQAVQLTDAERVVVRASRRIAAALPADLRDGTTVFGSPPRHGVGFLENGSIFEADVEAGQKTGHFLDQRDNRRLIGEQCRDADVLDVFCNTGGFTVAAARGGARSVRSIDSSSHAIAATERHVELNRQRYDFEVDHTTYVADAFDAMAELIARRVRYDVVIVDPPSFAPSAAAVSAAQPAYRRLAAMAGQLTSPGGTMLQASCSSRIPSVDFFDLVAEGLAEVDRRPINVVRTSHALDHPIGFAQGEYLKAILAQVVPVNN